MISGSSFSSLPSKYVTNTIQITSVWIIYRYVPQNLSLDFKFKPFIPDYIPAVGDIDAFLKVIPPTTTISGEPYSSQDSELGLVVLDEPAANQSDPALLHLQLRASSVSIGRDDTDTMVSVV